MREGRPQRDAMTVLDRDVEVMINLEVEIRKMSMAGLTMSMEHNHRIVILAAGIMGLVLPFVAQREGLAHPWFLGAAWTALSVCVVTGVAINLALRYTAPTLINQLVNFKMEEYGAALGVIKEQDDPDWGQFAEKITAADQNIARDVRSRTLLGLPVDLFFHGALLVGMYMLMRSIQVGGPS